MKLAPYVDKLNGSSEFKSFQKENKDAFMVAGFFVLDLEGKHNIHQIDYYIPSKKKIAAFTLDNHVTMQLLDLLNAKNPEKLDLKTNMDLDQLYGILEDEMKNRTITAEIKKIIAVLQTIEGKKIWNLSCVLSGMGILNAHIEDSSKSVLKMEKKSILDFVQKMSPAEYKAKLDEKKKGNGEVHENVKKAVKNVKEDVKQQIEKLNELEAAIEQEKDALVKQSKKESKKVKKK